MIAAVQSAWFLTLCRAIQLSLQEIRAALSILHHDPVQGLPAVCPEALREIIQRLLAETEGEHLPREVFLRGRRILSGPEGIGGVGRAIVALCGIIVVATEPSARTMAKVASRPCSDEAGLSKKEA